jgi:hypothetical protein
LKESKAMDYNDLINQRIKLKGVLLELKREVCYNAFDDKIRKQNILTIQASIKALDNKIINFKG